MAVKLNKMEKKQTAVSLIAENFNLLSDKDFKSWFLNSLDYLEQLEKQQIEKTWFDSTMQFDNAAEMTYKKSFEQYYSDTYGKD